MDDDGMFDPPSGEFLLIDQNAMRTNDIQITYNGPEWVQTINGPRIVYTKFFKDVPHCAKTARLALAEHSEDGNWTYKFISPLKSMFAPYGSNDIDNVAPRITDIDDDLNHYWREINDPRTEELIPLLAPSRSALRFVEGSRSIVFTATSPIDNTVQIFQYDIDTKLMREFLLSKMDLISTIIEKTRRTLIVTVFIAQKAFFGHTQA